MSEQSIHKSGTDNRSSTLLSRALQRAILVGVDMPGTDWRVEESLEELAQLAATAGVDCVDRVTQKLARPHPGTLLGSGKVQEIAELVCFHNCDGVIFDLELTPGQHRTLERELETQVLDRTALILMMPPAAHTPFSGGWVARGERFWEVTCMTYSCSARGGHYGRAHI